MMALWTISLTEEELEKPRGKQRSLATVLERFTVGIIASTPYSASFECDENVARSVQSEVRGFATVNAYSVISTHH